MQCTRISSILFLTFVGSFYLEAQQNAPKVLRVNAPSAVAGKAQPISVDLEQNAQAQKVTLRYRSFGETSFKGMEMLLSGNTATATIPADAILPPYVEYYFELQLSTGTETYPLVNPDANPLQFTVKPANPKDSEVRFLSPDAGETVAAQDLVIAVSLFYASDAVDRKATTLYLDGVNITSRAVWSDDVLLYSPQNFNVPLNLGAHFIRVELRDTTGKPYHAIEESFNLSSAVAIAAQKARLQSVGSANVEYRDEALSSGTTTYLRGDARLDNTYRSIGFGGSLHLDNQEKSTIQPQNRYLLYGQTDFLRLQYGDAFPKYPSLIMSGTRVRGITGNLALGFFNLDVTYGQTVRKVEGTYDSTYTYPSLSDASGRPLQTLRAGNDSTFQFFNGGTFTRNLLAVRPSFGSGENFQLGFTFMHAMDDTNSARYAVQPQENAVVGTDLTLAFDDQRVKLETQTSLSLVNTNISGGNFTDAQIDSLKVNSNIDLKGVLPVPVSTVEKIITINQNVFPTNPIYDQNNKLTTLPALSTEATLSLNYFKNFLRTQFFRRGAAYQSFGNPFLQTDIQGYQISDYLRLYSNRIFLSVSYEGKQDNTAFTKTGTTRYSNLNSSLAFNLAANIPSFQLGYGLVGRNNGQLVLQDVSAVDTALKVAGQVADEATNRYYFSANYDFVDGIHHTLTASISVADKKDNTVYRRNQSNSFLQFAWTGQFNIPLQTTLSILYSGNSNDQRLFYSDITNSGNLGATRIDTTATFNYTVITAGARYNMLGDNLHLAASISPQFGAFNRVTYTASADYSLNRHDFAFQMNYYQNSGMTDDKIFSLVYRFMF